MTNNTKESQTSQYIFSSLFFLFNFYLLYQLALGSASHEIRKKVKERANKICEGCGKNTKKLTVAHMDHTRNGNYNDPNKLKAYCTSCEFRHHASFIGRANETGLSEDDNIATVNGLWQTILREYKREEIIKLYKQYNAEILFIYKKFGYDISSLRRFYK